MSARPVKLQDIAEKAGVSAMTVSLALRGGAGSARMSAETRERILRTAESLNYALNARARALRQGRTNVVGLYAGHGVVNVRNPFFTEVVSGLQEGCEATRRDLLLNGMFHGSSPDDLYRELADGRIDGLVVSMPADAPLARKLVDSGFPVVAIADAIPGMPSVVADDADGMRQAVDHLFERGHRRVEFLLDPPHPTSARRRAEAFLDAGRAGHGGRGSGSRGRHPGRPGGHRPRLLERPPRPPGARPSPRVGPRGSPRPRHRRVRRHPHALRPALAPHHRRRPLGRGGPHRRASSRPIAPGEEAGGETVLPVRLLPGATT